MFSETLVLDWRFSGTLVRGLRFSETVAWVKVRE